MASPLSGTYLVRVLLLRYIALMYFVAFLVAYHQNPSLLGNCGRREGQTGCPSPTDDAAVSPDGLLPAAVYLQRVYKHFVRVGTSRPDQLPVWDTHCLLDSYQSRPFFLRSFLTEGLANDVFQLGSLDRVLSSSSPETVMWYTLGIPQRLFNSLCGSLGRQFGHCVSTRHIEAFKAAATVLWFVPHHQVDDTMNFLALSGAAIAAAILVSGRSHALLMAYLWVAYMSIVNVGQTWYSFGWESQLLETGFIAIFMSPFFPRVYPFTSSSNEKVKMGKYHSELPAVVKYGYRWLIVRIMLGAGFIKLRGDQCWRDMTCMEYHYQTQPVPNPFSILFHSSGPTFHAFEVWVNHFVECAAPFFILLPQPACAIGGIIQIVFQFTLISSGNLSFLNWLTIAPSIACFQDRHISWMFPSSSIQQAYGQAEATAERDTEENGGSPRPRSSQVVRKILVNTISLCRVCIHMALFLTLATLSVPVVQNLLSSRQAMNTSFDWLKLVNTYGAFGSVTKRRSEIIIEGKSRRTGEWLEYEFHCKPGNEWRLPCIVSPYHYRLDWLAWFAAFQNIQQNPWLVALAHRMLTAHTEASSRAVLDNLISVNPFSKPEVGKADDDFPVEIRIWLVPYEYNIPPSSPMRRTKGSNGQQQEESGEEPSVSTIAMCVLTNLMHMIGQDSNSPGVESATVAARHCGVRFWRRGPRAKWQQYTPALKIRDVQDLVNRLKRY